MTDDKFGKPFDALNTRGLTAKREYVRELVARADPQSLALLVECLGDESWYTRDLAEKAFLELGPSRADVLLPMLEQGLWYTRTSVARVLGRLAYRPAVPRLLRLTGDSNDTVTAAAREALIAIGLQGGAVRIAHALYRMPPDVRERRLAEIGAVHRVLRDRIERLMRHEDLMGSAQPDALNDDSAEVRASEEGVEWEILTGPPPPRERPEGGTGDA